MQVDSGGRTLRLEGWAVGSAGREVEGHAAEWAVCRAVEQAPCLAVVLAAGLAAGLAAAGGAAAVEIDARGYGSDGYVIEAVAEAALQTVTVPH